MSDDSKLLLDKLKATFMPELEKLKGKLKPGDSELAMRILERSATLAIKAQGGEDVSFELAQVEAQRANLDAGVSAALGSTINSVLSMAASGLAKVAGAFVGGFVNTGGLAGAVAAAASSVGGLVKPSDPHL